jgi:hypothetical protein
VEKKKHNPNSQNREHKKSQSRSGLKDYLKYAGMGTQMLVIIFIFTWVGIKLDQRTASEKQIYTAILSLLGVILGIYTVLKDFIGKNEDS